MRREGWQSQMRRNETNPPRKAPTGFRTGKGVASANLRDEVWKLRDVRRAADDEEIRRVDGKRIRDAMAFITTGRSPYSNLI